MIWRRRRRLERQLEDELRDHLERAAADLMAAGCAPAEARRRAQADFGSLEAVKDGCRDARSRRWVLDLAADVRYAIRMFRASPAFSGVAVGSLAVGIGAVTAIFSLVQAVLVKPLPVASPEQLVLLSERLPARQSLPFSTPHFEALAEGRALAALCAFRPWPMRAAIGDGVEMVKGQLVSGGCSAVLAVPPAVGRPLGLEDDRPGATPVAVISDALWQGRFGGTPDVLGRTVTLHGRAFTIVGVTPPRYHGAQVGTTVDVTVPLAHTALFLSRIPSGARWLYLAGRLAPGVDRREAQAELTAVWSRIADRPGPLGHDPNSRLEVLPGAQGVNDLRPQFSRPLGLLMFGVVLLLAIACGNLAGLLLARIQARGREISVRLALGAGRGRLVRQLLTESLVLAAVGGAGGVIVAIWGTTAVVRLLSRGRPSPIVLDVAPDLRLLAFAVATSVAAGLLVGLWPALRASGGASRAHLVASATVVESRRIRFAALVAAQVALSLVLLTAAGLFLRSLGNLRRVDVGIDRSNLALVTVPVSASVPGGGSIGDRYREIYARLSAIPGVRSATMSMDMPLRGLSWMSQVSVAGRALSNEDRAVSVNYVGPRFFETMGTPLVAGRDFREEDADGATAVISQSAARAWFPGLDGVGHQVRIGRMAVDVVGVVKDVRYEDVQQPGQHLVYLPYNRQSSGWGSLTIALRSDLAFARLAEAVRREVRAAAPDLPVSSLTLFDAAFDAKIATERILAAISAFFAATALGLLAVGVYGTLAYGVSCRRREIGVRIALGADRATILRLLLAGALLPVAGGVIAGVPLALAASYLARATLFGITSSDPATYAGVVAVLLAIAGAAAYLPARRAARQDPLVALRE